MFFGAQRHGLELERKDRDGAEEFASLVPPNPMARGVGKREGPCIAGRRSALDDLIVVVFQLDGTRSVTPATIDRDEQIVDVREQGQEG